MGCAIATAKRRRRQAAMCNAHLAKLGRRIYKKKSASKLSARLARLISAEKMRQQRKQNKK